MREEAAQLRRGFAWLYLALCGLTSCQAAYVQCVNGVEFVRALQDTSTTIVYIGASFSLTETDWTGVPNPLQLTRNLTITKSPALLDQPTLDLSFCSAHIKMEGDVELRIVQVVLARFRADTAAQAPGLDILAASSPGQMPSLIIQDGGLVMRACMPVFYAALATDTMARPPSYPGNQSIIWRTPQPEGTCVNDSGAAVQAPGMRRCWVARGQYTDLKTYGANVDPLSGKAISAGYQLLITDVTFLCERLMTDECAAQLGPLGCWLFMFGRSAQPSPSPSMMAVEAGGGKRSSSPTSSEVAAIVGGVVGGAVLLAIIAAAIMLLRRRPDPDCRTDTLPSVSRSEDGRPPGELAIKISLEKARKSRDGGDGIMVSREVEAEDRSTAASSAVGGLHHDGADPRQPQRVSLAEVTLAVAPLAAMMAAVDGSAAGGGARPPSDVLLDDGVSVPLVVVTPLTPPRADYKELSDVQAAQELRLIPITRGKGTYGRVLEGIYGGQRVAVKLLTDATGMPQDQLEPFLETFAREAEVLGRCEHPNVVRLLAANLQPPRVCLVMELMETSLDRIMYGKPGTRLPLATVLHIAIQVARGLEYLHPTIVHRDLKPGNVLINGADSERPIAKLTDFGLSRLRNTVLVTQDPEAGTPAYTAPECFDPTNYEITHQADIYSLGCLLHEMVVGERPWDGMQMVAIAYRVTVQGKRPAWPVGMERTQCPARLRKLVEECWDPVARRRPAAAEVVKRLMMIEQSVLARMDPNNHPDASDGSQLSVCSTTPAAMAQGSRPTLQQLAAGGHPLPPRVMDGIDLERISAELATSVRLAGVAASVHGR